ncbi:uncharacterized protein OCT59_019121 [Rhizophagus irregularis]|uniref:F-box domain-containing protein n=1 Tax=Rhizophagus irregularis (strain DAOM 181602 / DAOM 197198 / MUCL 43194) TaxID=747089 RepID=A0A2H5SUH5_RHIID|nr:hypothetical protein GLOIN_2v1790167 [Rhizophagus irregularis DAOM 181602=DAOM 197198]PKY30091.1 hypothetical protein RhiirB3_447010 [Rhizophagus irregularis]POG58620.1 hypothetical protein GLOIN_2v1790167 [Rhizophagus irregularis DAOM 181602=DAOM 197198]UZO26909.1 hypothetical protein OCT59_019121 [Rhizophagus irregularis]|eukprot:XP_025165486.1 hypothetical protein GLOIN_2v1790167 [Rhizophagus irregularis DAOM 181602=DAOM 197198]
MSCSKIFSGDLPELIYEIIKYLQNDYSTLYSCVLVNRLWCRLAIPLLWENPFSIRTRNYNFIEVYLYNLNDHLKTKLNEYQIIDNLLPSITLFNYPSFLKYISIYKAINSVAEWWYGVLKLRNRYFIQDNFGELVCMSLFIMFIENKVSLHTLEVGISTSYSTYNDNVLELILQNPNFIYNIRNLKFSISSSSDNTLIKNRISQLINLQKNLKKILFGSNSLFMYQSLLLSKESNCSNTLNTIIFHYVNFKGINNLVEVFERLNVLESVHIMYCYSLDTSFVQQIINLTKSFKLKSLFINEISQIESLNLLLQKSGNYLENFGCGGIITNFSQSFKRQILELIIKYCKSIKFFDMYRIENHTISQIIFNLIENIKQNLNYLTIRLWNYQDSNINLIILQDLGQTLPPKLEYLSLALNIKAIDFKLFLKSSQDTFFKKLVISNVRQEDGNYIDILPYVKEYIMKKKRAKYLAIKNTFTVRWERIIDLFDLKDEVMEFKSHNIKVLNYINLSTDIYRFLNEIN